MEVGDVNRVVNWVMGYKRTLLSVSSKNIPK